MTAVMLSIRPEWCAKIADGSKTIEVRKTRPKLKAPFKCYIYETQGKTEQPWMDEEGHMVWKGRGQVIGEFVCDKITYFGNVSTDSWDRLLGNVHEDNKRLVTKEALLSEAELHKYAAGKMLYGWHISELKIYDKPKELSEFLVEDNRAFDCPQLVAMKRAPQSWCYVGVKHGHWQEYEDYCLDVYYDCSVCGGTFYMADGTPTENGYNFCPKCGARMGETIRVELENDEID